MNKVHFHFYWAHKTQKNYFWFYCRTTGERKKKHSFNSSELLQLFAKLAFIKKLDFFFVSINFSLLQKVKVLLLLLFWFWSVHERKKNRWKFPCILKESFLLPKIKSAKEKKNCVSFMSFVWFPLMEVIDLFIVFIMRIKLQWFHEK